MGGMAIAGLGSVISGGLGFLGSQNQANASRDASNQQAQMQAMALQAQMIQNQRNQDNISPFLQTGTGAAGQLTNRLTDLTSPILMDQATLQNTPGYQFTLGQGLKAVQNSAAARGLGVSGAAMKGAANYATGLADNTYQNQFNNANTNQTNAFNRLLQTSSLGQNAAVGAGYLGQTNANAQSSVLGNIGTANASGTLGAANAQNAGLSAIGGGLNNLTSLYYMNRLLPNNNSGSMYTGSGGDTLISG